MRIRAMCCVFRCDASRSTPSGRSPHPINTAFALCDRLNCRPPACCGLPASSGLIGIDDGATPNTSASARRRYAREATYSTRRRSSLNPAARARSSCDSRSRSVSPTASGKRQHRSSTSRHRPRHSSSGVGMTLYRKRQAQPFGKADFGLPRERLADVLRTADPVAMKQLADFSRREHRRAMQRALRSTSSRARSTRARLAARSRGGSGHPRNSVAIAIISDQS